jgi:hypothetical protein
MKHIITSIVLFVLISCGSRSTVNNNQGADIVGKWKLTSYLVDIGDGNGTWQQTKGPEQRTIEFKSDGGFSDSENSNAHGYRLIAKDTIQFIQSNNSELYAVSILKLTDDSLVLRPSCIEACGERYVRIK